METVSTFNLNPTSSNIDILQSLRDELELTHSDLTEANEQQTQAAEYGLVLLEEKQNLQTRYEELNGLYETTKRELDSSVNVSPLIIAILL